MTNNNNNTVKFYSYSDSRSAKSCITIEQTPEIVQYIESNAARMGVSVQAVVDAMITARYNNCRYNVKTEKAPMDRATYELRKQLELAQCRPSDEMIEWRGYKFPATAAADILKRLNGQFSKPSKKQLLLFESEIAADDMPADAADTPDSQKTEETPAPAPVKKAKKFAVYRGAVVEVLDDWTEGNTSEIVVKIKGGSLMTVDAADLKATDAKKCTLPECFTDGGLLMHNGVLCRIEYMGSTRIELYYIDEEEYSSGQIVAVLHDWEPAPAKTPAEEPAPVSMVPAVAAPLAVVPVVPIAPTPRRRPDFRARWRRLVRPAQYLAAAFTLLIVSLLMGSSAGAFDAPADVVTAAAEAAPALVIELEPVTVTAPAVKKAADPQPPAVRTPRSQKNAPSSVTPAADDDETTADTMNEPTADHDSGTQPAPAFAAPSVPAGFSACFVAMYSTIMNNIN